MSPPQQTEYCGVAHILKSENSKISDFKILKYIIQKYYVELLTANEKFLLLSPRLISMSYLQMNVVSLHVSQPASQPKAS